ncbi:MAG: hypothetical protein U1F67_12940 [Rubrivivax sp.]
MPLRAGIDKALCMRVGLRSGQGSVTLRSPVFADHADPAALHRRRRRPVATAVLGRRA